MLSDGWRLPFVQLINWGKVAIALPEAMVQTPELLVAALPTDPHMIGEMRDASLRVYDKHFRTFGRRWDAMLLAARSEVQQRVADMRAGPFVGQGQEDPHALLGRREDPHALLTDDSKYYGAAPTP